MTNNADIQLKHALDEIEEVCSAETYNSILLFIEELEDEIEGLQMELDSIHSSNRSKRRRRNEEEWG